MGLVCVATNYENITPAAILLLTMHGTVVVHRNSSGGFSLEELATPLQADFEKTCKVNPRVHENNKKKKRKDDALSFSESQTGVFIL